MKLIVKLSNLVKNITNLLSSFFNSKEVDLNNKVNHQSQWLTDPYQPRSNFSQPGVGSRKIKNLGSKYTSQEVFKYLQGQGESERATWVIREASSFYIYDPHQVPQQFRGRERLYEKLPFVLYKYSQGWSTEEIAKSVSYFSTAEDVEEALLYISEVIARRINANLKASA